MYSHPGPLIKQYIEESGMKQKHIADQASIPIQSFNAMCNGKQRITVEQYFDICDVLGVSYSKFAPCDSDNVKAG